MTRCSDAGTTCKNPGQHRASVRLLPLMFIVVALAGCSDDTPSDADAPESSGISIPAPQWDIGHWWTFQTMNATGAQTTITAVVTGDEGGDWIVDTNDHQQALYDARTDVSYLGQVNKQTLAGSQGSDRVLFFDFPLELGKTWSANWDGARLNMEVMHIHDDGRAHIRAFEGSQQVIDYEYDASVGFFAYVDYLADGDSMFRMDLTDSGDAYTGEVVRYTLFEPIEFEGVAGAPVEAPFTLAEGVNELHVRTTLQCDAGGDAIVALQQPGEDGQEDPFRAWQPVSQPEYQVGGQCPLGIDDEEVIDAVPGPWRLDARITAAAGDFTVILEPRQLTTIVVS